VQHTFKLSDPLTCWNWKEKRKKRRRRKKTEEGKKTWKKEDEIRMVASKVPMLTPKDPWIFWCKTTQNYPF
jgi:hypothetical protein